MICPSCQKDVTVTEQNYGALYTCDQCQAVYFINFEGQAEYGEVPDTISPEMLSGGAGESVSAAQDRNSQIDSQINQADADPAFAFNEFSSEPLPPTDADETPSEPFAASLEPLIDTINVVSVDAPLEGGLPGELHGLQGDVPADIAADSVPAEVGELSSVDPAVSDDWSVTPEGNPFESAADPAAAVTNSFSQVAQEISDFGNTEVHLAGMNYDLHISGLDTQETMRLFKEAIEDSKFGWDAADLMKTVRNGQIRFQRLSPVKAYILAKRLQFLDIEKKWKQNVLS